MILTSFSAHGILKKIDNWSSESLSLAMDMSDVCPTEDAVRALLEHFVDPMLPAKSSLLDNPSQSQRQAVAKQVHAVLLLYNYYHRKQNRALEHLGFDSFCKLAVILKPTLLGHLKFMQISNVKDLDDPENQLSIMEKTIMHACDISKVLDASRENPNVEGWPLTKVAVFLVDSKNEKCLLLFNSITQGVWSVIEKDPEVLRQSSDSTTETKQVDKKRRVIRKPSIADSKINLAGFLQLAYSAVKELTGVTQADLIVLEDGVAYSVNKEKEATRFYIMQCTKPVNDDAIQVSINDVMNSLQGPLFEKSSGRWTVTPVVEHFHVLPYAGILSEWMHKLIRSNSLQDSMLGESSKKMKSTSESAKRKNQDSPHMNSGTKESCNSKTTGTNLKSAKEKDMIDVSNTFSSPRAFQITKQYSDISYTTQVENNQNLFTSNSTESEFNDQESGVSIKFEMVDSTTRSDGANCRLEKVGYGNKIGDNISSDQIGTANLSLITHRSNSNHLDRIQVTIASKENILSQTAVKVLMRRRDKLSLQLRHLQDDIAECDRKIHTILNGGDDDFALKIESIIEGCNDVCVRSVTEERTCQLFDDQSSPQYGKRKKLPEAILSIQNPCQELDALCHANDWILPTYHVCPAKGGFKANVTIKGEDFDYSSEGDLHSKPREARESAAALILQKFRSLAAQGQHL